MIPVALVSLVEGWLGPRFAKLAKPLLIGVGVLLLCLAVWVSVEAWQFFHSPAPQSRVGTSQAAAASNSAADAVNTVAASGEASAASEALTRSNERDIRNAQGSDAPVNPAARDAGLHALCLRDAYRADPRCRVQQPHS